MPYKFERDKVLDRFGIKTNYEDAVDSVIPSWRVPIQRTLKYLGLPSGLSNCTLSVTQAIDPKKPIMRAHSIVTDPSLGYTKINAEDAIPGDVLITRNPDNGSYHTMLIEGFDNQEPLLRYSTGGHNNRHLRKSIRLDQYHTEDNKQGGYHTEELYYRYNYPKEVFLEEITVTPRKKVGGIINYLSLFK